MAKPKLALIPAAQGDKFYSVLPSDGVGDFTFTRASTGTRIAPTGLIEEVPSGDSRLDYDLLNGKVVNCPHYLLEPARTNLVAYSEDFTNGWILDGVTVLSDNLISPDGSLNADKITFVSGNERLYYIISTSSAVFSLYLKGENGKKVRIRDASGFIANNITLTDKWERYDVFINQSSSNIQIENINSTYVYAWGAQLEAGSYPTSYIPTNGTAITRAAESANGSGNAATFNDSEGVLMAEISALANDLTNRRITIDDGTGNNRIILGYYSLSNSILIDIASQGTGAYTKVAYVPAVTNFNKIALKYKENDFALWVNGLEIDVDLSGITPINLNNLKFDGGSGAVPFYGNTRELQYFDSVLTDAQLETLTSWTSLQEMITSQLYTNY